MFQNDEKKQLLRQIETEEKEEWDEFYAGISKQISEIRLEKKIGIPDLSDRTAIDIRHIYRIEKNQKHAGLISLVKIARGLGVSVDDLLPTQTESEEVHKIKQILSSCDSRQLAEINQYLDKKYGRK